MEEHKHEKEQLTKGFFSWVFYMDEKMKFELINIGQYIGLAFLFLSILVYLIDTYLPIIDETNSSFEIIIKLLLFLYILFYSIYFINRIICYIPTFSAHPYPDYIMYDSKFIFSSIFSIIIATISYHNSFKLGIHSLFDRLKSLISTSDETPKKKKKKVTINENENTTEQQSFQQSLPPMNSPLYTGNTTSINQLPVVNVQKNNYQEDFQNQGQPPEPMAANESGSPFGSIFG
jgi:hypothetical protein